MSFFQGLLQDVGLVSSQPATTTTTGQQTASTGWLGSLKNIFTTGLGVTNVLTGQNTTTGNSAAKNSAAGSPPATNYLPWILGGAAVLLLVGLIVYKSRK